jgi:hypothetical protein
MGTSLTVTDAIRQIKAHIQQGDKAKDKADQHYHSAGLLLKELRENCSSKAAWERLIKDRCGIGRSRAYELIAIAEGRKTIADVRLANTKRKQKERSVRDVTDKSKPEPAAASSGEQNNLPDKVEPAPTATTAKSWKVEAVAIDGRRYGNGVRLETEEEADAYRSNATMDLLIDEAVIAISTEVIPCGDEPSGVRMLRKKGGRLKGHFSGNLAFLHGTCGTLGWGEIATPTSSGNAETNPLVAAWDKAGPKQRHDFVLARKVEIMKVQQQIGWFAHGDVPPGARTAAGSVCNSTANALNRMLQDAGV